MSEEEKYKRIAFCQKMINSIIGELGPDEAANWTFIIRKDPNSKDENDMLWYGAHISGMSQVRPMYKKPEEIVLEVCVSENEFTSMNFTGSGMTFKAAWLDVKKNIDNHMHRINWVLRSVLPTKVVEAQYR